MSAIEKDLLRTGTIWRPPFEAYSALLQVAAGCTHHKCKFCTLYEDVPFKFRMSPLSEIEEDLSMLTIYKTSELYQEIQKGNWKEETEIEKLMELKVLIQELKIPTYFATMGVSNCIWVEGNLPKDKQKMIAFLEQVIGSADERELRRYRENLPHL